MDSSQAVQSNSSSIRRNIAGKEYGRQRGQRRRSDPVTPGGFSAGRGLSPPPVAKN